MRVTRLRRRALALHCVSFISAVTLTMTLTRTLIYGDTREMNPDGHPSVLAACIP